MSHSQDNIHPTFDRILQKEDKERLLNQRGLCVWMTGLSGSGKTTIATALERELYRQGRLTQVLDGDNVRTGINSNLGFSAEDRSENIRRIAEVSKLFAQCGIVTICCFVSPTIAMRKHARDIIGEKDFVEVFVNTPFEVCEQRDVKGLYKKARAGELKNFTGLDAPFESPVKNFIDVPTGGRSAEQCAEQIMQAIATRISLTEE